MEEKVVGLGVLRGLPFDADNLVGRQDRMQSLGHVKGDLGLHGEYISGVSLVDLGPEAPFGPGVYQVDRDAGSIAFAVGRSLEDVQDAEGVGDLWNLARPLSVHHGRLAGDDLEAGDLGQERMDLRVDAFGEIGVVGVGALILEREDGDGYPVTPQLDAPLAQQKPSDGDTAH